MLSATMTLPDLDLAHAAGHTRTVMESAGFCARGILGRSPIALFASCTPLVFTGLFSRCVAEVSCRRSLNEGDDTLHLSTRVRSLGEFEDFEEANWLTRGPGEMLGDALQNRRVLRKLMSSLSLPTNAAPDGFGTVREGSDDPKARRAKFQERYKKAKTRRKLQLISAGVALAALFVLNFWLN